MISSGAASAAKIISSAIPRLSVFVDSLAPFLILKKIFGKTFHIKATCFKAADC